jgi:uncharacterized metal-binding protein YceD (DUF177 family)
MIIRLEDIPLEGKELSFELDNEAFNERISAAANASSSKAEVDPPYVFDAEIKVSLQLMTRGSSVALSGSVCGEFTSPCARCNEEVRQKLETPIDHFLKLRRSEGSSAPQDEDVGFGFHDGESINCSEIAEEMLVLSLPMVVRCGEDTICAQTADEQEWVFGQETEEEQGDERMKIFRSLKIH